MILRFLEGAGAIVRESIESLGFATRAFFNLLRFRRVPSAAQA